jgi:DNA repair exonuclease SbcCD nuclease subunit
MRIAHLADLHLGRPSPSDPRGARRLTTLRYALECVAKQSPSAILVAGDTFHSLDVEEAVILQAARLLESTRDEAGRPIPTVVIPGNHDPADATWLWTTFEEALSSDSALTLVRHADCAVLCEGRLLVEAYPCPTRYSAEPPWADRVALPQSANGVPHVVLAHGTLLGGPVPDEDGDAYPFTDDSARALGADYVALGHFHGIYPAWDGADTVERLLCYAGTHEPDQFGSDSGWVLLADLEKGRPARLTRLRVGRTRWELLEISSAADLARLEALQGEVEGDAEPQRFVIRLKVDRRAQFSPEDAARLESAEAALSALGAQLDRRGEMQAPIDPARLDLAGLPNGAVKQALMSLREEYAVAPDEQRRDVLAAALRLGAQVFETVG